MNSQAEERTAQPRGRPGVSQKQVQIAIESLESAGKTASIREIREKLGSGSHSTISTLVRRIRRETPSPSEHGSLQRRLSKIVDEELSEIQQRYRIQVAEKDALIHSLQAAKAQDETLVAELSVENKLLSQSLNSAHERADLLAQQLLDMQARCAELESRLSASESIRNRLLK